MVLEKFIFLQVYSFLGLTVEDFMFGQDTVSVLNKHYYSAQDSNSFLKYFVDC